MAIINDEKYPKREINKSYITTVQE